MESLPTPLAEGVSKMRLLIGVLSACVLAGWGIGVRAAAASDEPILLVLNPPLLTAPVTDGTLNDGAPELPNDTQSEGPTASSKPKSTPDATPDEGKPDIAPDGAVEKSDPPPTEEPSKENSSDQTPADTTQSEPADSTPADTADVQPLSQELAALRTASPHAGGVLPGAVQHSRQLGREPSGHLSCVRLRGGGAARRRLRSGPERHHVPVLELPLRRTRTAANVRRPDRPPRRPRLSRSAGRAPRRLALARVPCEYPIRVGNDVRKVDDLVEYEKLTCREGGDLSLKLIGLARYLSTDDSWKNDAGETWSISRIVRELLAAPGDKEAHGGTDRLFALSYVVDCRVKRGEPLDGQFKRAADYVDQFRNFAFDLQNPDGTWHPRFFAYRGQGGTAVDVLYSTGRILRWLVLSLPEDQLQDPRIVRSVATVNRLLADSRTRSRNLPSGSAREIDARMNAIHALALYDHRVFQPRDAVPEGNVAGKGTEKQ